MIFITLGSQKFQFDRILIEVDQLVFNKKIDPNEVFAQTGFSTYVPKHFSYKKFLNKEEFTKYIDASEIVITHGGTGAIINSVKKRRKVIAIPRSVNYGEHVDNHQYEIVEQFNYYNLIYALTDIKNLNYAICKVNSMNFKEYSSNTLNFISLLEKQINIFTSTSQKRKKEKG